MERKSIFWLISSISVFVFGCICFYAILHHHVPDVRLDYSVDLKTKVLLKKQPLDGAKINKVADRDKHDSIALAAIKHSKRKYLGAAEPNVVETVLFDSLPERTDRVRAGAGDGNGLVKQIETDGNGVAYVESKQQNEHENVDSEVIPGGGKRLLRLVTVNELLTINVHPVTVGSKSGDGAVKSGSLVSSSYIVLDGTEEAYLDPISSVDPRMRALGGGTSEDELNTGGGSDNTTTYNDNNTVGSLPVEGGVGELMFCLVVFVFYQYVRTNKNTSDYRI